MLGRPWRARLDAAGTRRAQQIAQGHGLPDLVARVLASRGCDSADCLAYVDPSLRSLMPDPDVMVDMPAAVDRLARAVAAGERVAVLGDYDVDGAAAAALLVGYLRAAASIPPSTFRTGWSTATARACRPSQPSPRAGRRCSSRWIAARPAMRLWRRRRGAASTPW